MRKIVFLIFLLTFSIEIKAQKKTEKNDNKFKIQYELNYVKDTLFPNKKEKEIFTLYIDNNLSKFVSNRKLHIDSLSSKARKDNAFAMSLLANLSKIPKTNFSFEIYKNSITKEIVVIDKIIKNKYIYKDDYKNEWILTSDTLTIQNYKCQKSLLNYRGRKYEAWYTTEIPISNGPFKFQGLPGLIIKINDSKRDYSFELIGLIEDKNVNIAYPKEKDKWLISTTLKEFKKTLLSSSKNYFSQIEMSGITLNKQGKKMFSNKLSEKLKNPIELKIE